MATQKAESKLTQTKSFFRLHGFITGKDTVKAKGNNGFTEAMTGHGDAYRSLRFMVKTSEKNQIPVEMFGMVQEFAYMYSKKEKKTEKIKWSERNTKKKEGYELIKPDYDACEEIHTTFKDGDAICVIGVIDFSTYTNEKTGKTTNQKKFIIKQAYPIDTSKHVMDFNDENFEEDCIFEQEIVIAETFDDKDLNKLIIYANTIAYGDKVNPATLEINKETAPEQFVKNMKALKYGDFIKVSGIVNNRAIDEIVAAGGDWGTTQKTITTYLNSLEITGAYGETLEKKLYTEGDLITENKQESKVKAQAKKTFENIQKIEDETDAEEDDEELPFDL